MAKLAAAKEVERLLAKGELFQVSPMNCMNHAEILKGFKRHEELALWSTKTKSEQLAFKVAFIAICHQFNWDFLQGKIYELLFEQKIDLVNCLRSVRADQIEKMLSAYPDKSRIRSRERARLLRDVGNVLFDLYGGNLDCFYAACAKAPLSNGSFHSLLDRFEAYRIDPLKKKTNVLSHELHVERIIEFADPQSMEPAIDYHIMRIYIRTGRVVFLSDGVGSYLKGSPNPRGALVRALRACVAEAAKLTASYSGLSVADLNFLEWQVGRAVCANDDPRCDSREFHKPLASDVAALCTEGCLYRTVCVAKNELASFLSLEEPKHFSSAY